MSSKDHHTRRCVLCRREAWLSSKGAIVSLGTAAQGLRALGGADAHVAPSIESPIILAHAYCQASQAIVLLYGKSVRRV
jgi:hypothetical protein